MPVAACRITSLLQCNYPGVFSGCAMQVYGFLRSICPAARLPTTWWDDPMLLIVCRILSANGFEPRVGYWPKCCLSRRWLWWTITTIIRWLAILQNALSTVMVLGTTACSEKFHRYETQLTG